VNVGTDVRLAGIKVGSVVAEELNPETFQARVTMTIDPKLKLTDDTTAKISSEGLLGEPFIALEPGGSETMIEDGGEIQFTQGAVDIWKLVSEAMFSKPSTSSSSGQTSSGTGEPPSETKSPEAPPVPDDPQSNVQQ
jgi:phospholipid/cholesterol/gamma-HCH transport system substrate-binding protein